MWSRSPGERLNHTAEVAVAANSHAGSKRASPLDENGVADEGQKRVRIDTIYDQGDRTYLSDARSVGSHSRSPSAIETSSQEDGGLFSTNWLDVPSAPTQSVYDTSRPVHDELQEDLSALESSVGNIAVAGKDGLRYAFPSIEITKADGNCEFDDSFYMSNALLLHSSMDTPPSANLFLDDSTSSCSQSDWLFDEVFGGDFTRQSSGENVHHDELNPSLVLQHPSVTNEIVDSLQSVNTPVSGQESSSSITGNDENTPTTSSHDTCFGVVLLPFQSSLKTISENGKAAVELTAYGDMLKLSISGSKKYAGIVEAAALCALLQTPSVTLNGTFSVARKGDKNVKQASRDSTSSSFSDCLLRVSVSGQGSEKQEIGRLLSEADLFLQHPVREEIGKLRYENPHFLLRPGSDMPSLEQLSLMSDQKSDESSDVLEESSLSLIMRVFDSESEIDSSLITEASDRLRAKLENHQYIALAMMQEKECGVLENTKFSSLWRCATNSNGTKRFRSIVTGDFETNPKPFFGGILADEMGLGKTLTILALICWSVDMRAEDDTTKPSKSTGMTLVVTPKSAIKSWQDQIKKHIKAGRIKHAIFHGTSRALSSKSKEYDIILTTYETLRSDWSSKKILYSQEWDRIVLDEAHHIRSSASQTFKAACQLQARCRWCLSGTPICNSLNDYGSLLTFIDVQPFADRKAFNSWILEPIKAKRPDGLRRLEHLVRATCLRRKKSQNTLTLELPSKFEKVHWVDLSPDDQELYKFFKLKAAKLAVDLSLRRSSSGQSGEKGDANIVTLINILRRICDHGKHLLPKSALEVWNKGNGDPSVSAQLPSLMAPCDWCGRRVGSELDNGLGCEHVICAACSMDSDLELSGGYTQCPKCAKDIASDAGPSTVANAESNTQPSAKILAVLHNLSQEQSVRLTSSSFDSVSKSLIFSVWTKMLDLVQYHLLKNGFTTVRIDGSCTLQQRGQAMRRFTEDPSCTVMLASIGSAGEGVDLTAANNVHLLEPHWNPMQEAQAIDRVHRISQRREVHVTRYLTCNTIETYVQWIQQEKIRLINRTLDSLHISQAEIDEKRWDKLQEYIGSLNSNE